MQRAALLKSRIAILSALFFVTLAYTIRAEVPELGKLEDQHGRLAWAVVFAISWFLSNVSTAWLWEAAIRVSAVRRYLIGLTWLEGAWFFQGVGHDQKVLQVTIGQYRYDLPDLTLHGHFENRVLHSGEMTHTDSLSMAVSELFKYTHYFTRSTLDGEPAGVAAGTFSLVEGTLRQYRGVVVYSQYAEGTPLAHSGIKLDAQAVTEWRKQFGSYWPQAVLQDKEILENLLRQAPLAVAKTS